MKHDPITLTLLFDEYGVLLTDKQRDCCDLYFNQDLSLAEIADELGISRQGVHDSITRAEAALRQLEDALGNVARRRQARAALAEITQCAAALAKSEDETVRTLAARIAKAAKQVES